MKYSVQEFKILANEGEEISIFVNHTGFTSLEISSEGVGMMYYDSGDEMMEFEEPSGGYEPRWFMDLIFTQIEEFDYN